MKRSTRLILALVLLPLLAACGGSEIAAKEDASPPPAAADATGWASELTLSPDGRTLYAANPALGVVAEIDLAELSVTGRASFRPQSVSRSGLAAPASRSAVSPDGRLLYFAAGRDVWVYDAQVSQVRGPFGAGEAVAALGLSGDGTRLYVAPTDGRPFVLDAQTGRTLSFPA